MFIAEILIIITTAVLNILIFIKFIKEKYLFNLMVSFLSLITLGIYCANFVINIMYNTVILKEYIENILLIFMIVVPLLVYVIEINIRIFNLINIKRDIKMKKYEQAIEKLLIHVKRFGKTDNSYYLLGLCYKEIKEYIEARDTFAIAVENNPSDYKAYFEFGNILEMTGKQDTAIIMYKNCLKLKPNYYEALESLGIVYTSCKMYNDAVKIYETAISYHSEASELYYNLAMIQMELKMIEAALDNFIKASQYNSTLYSASYNAGIIKKASGDIDGAIEFLKKARSSTIYGGRAYYELAKIYSSKNEINRAKTCLEYAILINPDFLKDAKTEIVFTNIKEYLYEFDDELKKLELNKKSKINYISKD